MRVHICRGCPLPGAWLASPSVSCATRQSFVSTVVPTCSTPWPVNAALPWPSSWPNRRSNEWLHTWDRGRFRTPGLVLLVTRPGNGVSSFVRLESWRDAGGQAMRDREREDTRALWNRVADDWR